MAMGNKVALNFACIFMGWLKSMILAIWMGTQPHLWRRYIDNIFFLWYGTEEEPIKFIEHCNLSHETIKFTFYYDFKTYLSISWIVTFGLITRVGYRQICSRRMARNFNSFFTAVLIPGLAAARFLTV